MSTMSADIALLCGTRPASQVRRATRPPHPADRAVPGVDPPKGEPSSRAQLSWYSPRAPWCELVPSSAAGAEGGSSQSGSLRGGFFLPARHQAAHIHPRRWARPTRGQHSRQRQHAQQDRRELWRRLIAGTHRSESRATVVATSTNRLAAIDHGAGEQQLSQIPTRRRRRHQDPESPQPPKGAVP